MAADHPAVVMLGLMSDPPSYVDQGVVWLLGLSRQAVIDDAVDSLCRASGHLPIHNDHLLDRSHPAVHDALGGDLRKRTCSPAEVASISTALQALPADALLPQEAFDDIKQHYSSAATNGWGMEIF